jgi:hypothetical protein
MPKGNCSKCGIPLKIGFNISECKFKKASYYCNKCSNDYKTGWRYKNKEGWLAYERERGRIWRLKVIEILGGKCSNSECAVLDGMTDWRALQIDHINGGGCKVHDVARTATFYKRVYEFVKANSSQTEYQILCANCNNIKRWTNHENVI